MSRILTIHLPDATEARLEAIALELGVSVVELAENAVAEACLDFFHARGFRDDPARSAAPVRGADIIPMERHHG